MKNLFDYATKELSQDAFLSWFIANCNDERFNKHAYNFINLITGFNFKVGDIKKVKITQQVHKMDIVADVWTSEKYEPQSHYVIVIEDKTFSSAHSGQLKKYADELAKWNNDEEGYIFRRRKVFYKTDYLTKEDEDEIKDGNEGYNEFDHWLKFDINAIYGFFSKIGKTKSEVLNYYIEHIASIYADLNDIPKNKPMNEWNLINFQTFFRKEIPFNESNSHFETWQYQGRLASMAYYYHPVDPIMDYAYPLVEFVFRKNSKRLLVYSHITFHNCDENEDKWTWKWSGYKSDDNKAKRYTDLIKESLKETLHLKPKNMDNKRNQTITADEIALEGKTIEEVKKEILQKIELYFFAYKNVDKQ